MVLGKLPVLGHPTIWIRVGQGPTGCLDIFTLDYPFCPLSPSLWETARYRLKYCLKGPLNPKQPNQPISRCFPNTDKSWINYAALTQLGLLANIDGSCNHFLHLFKMDGNDLITTTYFVDMMHS